VVTRIADGAYRVEIGGRSAIVYVAGAPGDLWAFCDGRVYRQRDREPHPTAQTSAPGTPQPLTAPMPGAVVKVLVVPGQRVAPGEPLVILEAMKMELPLSALDSAVVAAVRCHEGELVQGDALLVEFTARQ
jgi:acetyl/propionyl-CoA carboxylase alpha subunit